MAKALNLSPAELEDLYKDNQKCAQLIGLAYTDQELNGFTRQKQGKGFRYLNDKGKPLNDQAIKQRISELVIPPAWKEVWICPKPNGHLLVTGIDEKGRKQYMYHPKWRQIRDLLKFYRMITFGEALPKIRQEIDACLHKRGLSQERIVAAMLWILDTTYIRVGNDIYLQDNDSVGLTTLSGHNAIVEGALVTLSFRGKSGKDHILTFENKSVADIVTACRAVKGERLFRYKTDDGSYHDITADDINASLHDITGTTISAKDFRTWGGTLAAFDYLVEEIDSDEKPEKIAIQAVDAAADVLGNTRAVARSSYVHPDILEIFNKDQFRKYYKKLGVRRQPELDKREKELLQFLELLFKEEFELLKI
jgi:DNA topoisomerase-1